MPSKLIKSVTEGILILGAASVLIAGADALGRTGHAIYRAISPAKVEYRDVNNDGILDEVSEAIIRERRLLPIVTPSVEKRVRYGVEVNGRRIYLPEREFNEFQTKS